MPPKTKNLDDLVSAMSTQLDSILDQLKTVNEKLSEYDEKFKKLERLLEETKTENEALKTTNISQQETIDSLKEKVNSLEQRNRARSIRLFNLPLTGNASDNDNVADQVFSKVLKPILRGALDRGRLSSFPTREEVIEVAHILPGKSTNNPILCKLRKPLYHQLILQLKKDFAPRAPAPASRDDKRPGPLLYPIFEDATRDTFLFMKKLAADDRVLASWISGGTVRYRLRSAEDTVHRVRSIYAPFENNFST